MSASVTALATRSSALGPKLLPREAPSPSSSSRAQAGFPSPYADASRPSPCSSSTRSGSEPRSPLAAAACIIICWRIISRRIEELIDILEAAANLQRSSAACSQHTAPSTQSGSAAPFAAGFAPASLQRPASGTRSSAPSSRRAQARPCTTVSNCDFHSAGLIGTKLSRQAEDLRLVVVLQDEVQDALEQVLHAGLGHWARVALPASPARRERSRATALAVEDRERQAGDRPIGTPSTCPRGSPSHRRGNPTGGPILAVPQTRP